MAKVILEHRDLLGRVLNIGDCVAYPQSNNLAIGVIRKLNPKMIGVKRIGHTGWGSEKNRYPQDCVKLEGPEVTMFIIKHASKEK